MLDIQTLKQRYSQSTIAIKIAVKELKDYKKNQNSPDFDQELFLNLYNNYLSKRTEFIEIETEYKNSINV
ncbi:MAG: hypothetical protein CMF41_01245 [Legionellales bacterium]|nr:hypothetical protein [Legionellales bacterium]|tara:strand:+ start:3939 stop:4148 length:210 start_codon:yes stop_codon:yes gene_type:complete